MTQRKGLDAAQPVARFIPAMKANGIDFACRYYPLGLGKSLSKAEAQELSDAGIDIVTVFETSGDRALEGADAGTQDAGKFLAAATELGQPEGSGAYFTVDTDVTDPDDIASVIDYFTAIKAGLGGHFRPGGYCEGTLAADMLAQRIIELWWVPGAGGWDGSRAEAAARRPDITQAPERPMPNPLGLDYDPNIAGDPNSDVAPDFGQWRLPASAAAQPAGEQSAV